MKTGSLCGIVLLASLMVTGGCSHFDLVIQENDGVPIAGAEVVSNTRSVDCHVSRANRKGEARVPMTVPPTKWVSIYKDGYRPVEYLKLPASRPIMIKLTKSDG